ncbi:hypothetical protein WISP_138363 [Willisornis vidua]|uniref:Uncharacterized protein n=1 Tax=Willisornis vidua TaxID=1566151 RepID=A0ABQ9CQR7_9PASS|nr:hypothetical protein WISP_138363 [Willisornis vidua]
MLKEMTEEKNQKTGSVKEVGTREEIEKDKAADKGQIFTADAITFQGSRGESGPIMNMPESREVVRERRNEVGV